MTPCHQQTDQSFRILSRCALFFGILSVCVGVSAAAEDEIVIQRDEPNGTTTILVSSRSGTVKWNSVFRGIARAARLDDEAIPREFEGETIDLTKPDSRV